MKILKRAWISIMRRKMNSLVLLLIVFILANVLLTTLTVTTSLKDTKKMVLDQFPPVVTIEFNYETFDTSKEVKLTAEMANNLYKNTEDIVKSYDYTLFFGLDRSEGVKIPILSDLEMFNSNDDNLLVKLLPIVGTQLPATKLVAKEEATMISGQGFDKTDISEGKPKIIVSRQFAEVNGLEVGSFLPMYHKLYNVDEKLIKGEAYFSEEVELEVVGVIEIKKVEEFVKKQEVSPSEDINEINDMHSLVNTLHCTNSYINLMIDNEKQQILEKYPDGGESQPGTIISNHVYPEFILNDMKDLDTFTAAAKEIYKGDEYLITSAANEYEVIAKPLDSMEMLLSLVFKITVMASILVLTLVLCIFMYLRQKEMGIYLALGEHRSKIVSQLLMETLIISIVGATLAIFTALIFSNMLTQSTINSLASVTSNTNQFSMMGNSHGLSAESISNQYQGGFNVMTLVIFYITMIGTIVISQLATVLYLLRLNPKKILM